MDKLTESNVRSASNFITSFSRIGETHFIGHVLLCEAPQLHFVVETLVDGEPVGLVRADGFSADLRKAGYPDDHGFVFLARRQHLTGQHQIEARIANLATPVGIPIDLRMQPFAIPSADSAGSVEWLGGLRIAGTIAGEDAKPFPTIRVHESGALVAESNARRWTASSQSREQLVAAHFDFYLPDSLADGRPHRLTVTDEMGRELAGSPLHLLALPDALKNIVESTPDTATEGLRAEWFDRFLPKSVPFENFDTWKDRFEPSPLELKDEPPIRIVVIGDQDVDTFLNRLEGQTHRNWSATVLPPIFDWSALQDAVTAEAEDGAILVFLRSSIALRHDALARLAQAMATNSDSLAAYCDIEIVAGEHSHPLFFGAFDYERMLEQGYAATLFALRAGHIKIPAEETTGSPSRLLLTLCDAEGADGGRNILHVPGLLASATPHALPTVEEVQSASAAHLRARKVKADVRPLERSSTLPAIRIKRAIAPRSIVSIIVPTRDRVDLLAPCLDSLLNKTPRKTFELIIVDNGSRAPETLAYLESMRHKGHQIIDVAGPFNYSFLNNVGVAASKGRVICLLNNDTEVTDPYWLDELLSRLSDPTVGAVSPKLVWPNRMVQHGGIVLGPNFAASDAFNNCTDDDPGYGNMLLVAHEMSALTAACLMVRRSDYDAVQGFDETKFPVLFNDVDFCLKLRALGKRNIFTPHATLIHHESATRGPDERYSQKSRFKRELDLLRAKWGDVLANDPLYSPFLNLDPYPFSALAWPPRLATPRLNTVTPREDFTFA